jgi:glycosyltransferase involved in cell wall biosynthesis
MHVLHYGKYYPPYRGGIENVTESICRGLAARGVRVTALVSNDRPVFAEEKRDGVHVIRLPRRAVLKSQPINPGVERTLRALNPDVIHTHLPNPLAAWRLLRYGPPVPWIAHHHSDLVRQRLLRVPADAVNRRFYERCAAICVATPRHIEFSNILPPFAAKCRIMHYGIDPAPYRDAPDTWDAALPADRADRPLVLFVGRLVYYKGIDVLLRALPHAPGAEAALVGIGPLEASLRAMARELGVADRVHFLGDVSPERLRALYKRAAVFVLPSVAPSEAFGVVQLEAMAAGTPVICTDLPSGVPYVNRHGVTGLVVPPRDADALGAALHGLLADPERRRLMGVAGERRVTELFDDNKLAAAYLSLYEEVIAAAK